MLVLLLLLFGMPLVIAWDAGRKGESRLVWGLVAFFLGPIDWLLYIVNAQFAARRRHRDEALGSAPL